MARPPIESIQHIKERKLCCLQWHHLQDERKSLIRYTGILDRFVVLKVSSSCTALGVPGKANFLSNSCKNPPGMVLLSIKQPLVIFTFWIFGFSDFFYIDWTNEQTLQTDLKAIAPGNTERSADANLRWLGLASQREGNGLLFLDNWQTMST